MSLLPTFAKSAPPVTVQQHASDVAAAIDGVLRSPAVRRVCETIGVNWEACRRGGIVTAICHDAGKAVPEWQERMSRDWQPPTHADVSAAVTAATADTILNQLGRVQNPDPWKAAATAAILYHHTPMNSDVWESLDSPPVLRRRAQSAVNILSGSSMPVPDVGLDGADYIEFPATEIPERFAAVDLMTEKLQSQVSSGELHLGARVALLRGALIQADRAVSRFYEQQSRRPAESGAVEVTSDLSPSDVLLHSGVRPFQQQLLACDPGEVVAKAGCGEGKTAAALAWAANRVAAGDADRLVFALPTRTTANTMAESINSTNNSEVGVQERVGLYHSSASVEPFTAPGSDSEAVRVENLPGAVVAEAAAKWLQTPVTVTTVDHVLRTLLNSYPFAGVARMNLLRSAVVFDEIHAYDDRLQACLGAAVQWLRQFGVPWLTLTATQTPPASAVLPDDITTITSVGCRDPTMPVASLTQAAPCREDGVSESDVPSADDLPVAQIVDTAARKVSHHPDEESESLGGRVEVGSEPRAAIEVVNREGVDSTIRPSDVLNAASKPGVESVLVVRNTVKDARQLARALADEGAVSVTYYSSEFPNEHRARKETELTSQFGVSAYPAVADSDHVEVAVVTQIAELSLDVTADILLTDLAPVDAVVQRAGRIHRDGTAVTTEGCDCKQCAVQDDVHQYRVVVYDGLAPDEPLYPYLESGDETMRERLERTVEALQSMDAVAMAAVEAALTEVYNSTAGGGGEDFIAAAKTDFVLGPDRRVSDGGETQLNIQLRDIEGTYRTEAFPAMYRELPGLSEEGIISESGMLSPEQLWEKLHDCDGPCGVFSSGDEDGGSGAAGNKCQSEWVRFCRQWTIPVPARWLRDDSDAGVATRPVFPDDPLSVADVPVVSAPYTYSVGVQPDEADQFHRPPRG